MKHHGFRNWGPRRPRPYRRKAAGEPMARVGLAITLKDRDKIKLLAFEEDETMSEWIRDAIERKLKDEESD